MPIPEPRPAQPQAVQSEAAQAGVAQADPAAAGFFPLAADPHHPGPSAGELDDNPRYLVRHGFHSSLLPDDRDVLVYLPEAYLHEPSRHFPVLYLHDGQNLFDGRTSYRPDHTWRAHATADWLTREGRVEPLILVGINNTGLRRMPEYTPTPDPRYRGGEGDRYGALLATELKPLIDSTFRTLPGPAHTGLGGSSLGGLISLYLGLEYPQLFGQLAVLSPSVWWDSRSILRLLMARHVEPRPRIWLDMGTAEGLRHGRDTDLLARRLLARGWEEDRTLRYTRIPGAVHDEDAWAARFGDVLRFLFPTLPT